MKFFCVLYGVVVEQVGYFVCVRILVVSALCFMNNRISSMTYFLI